MGSQSQRTTEGGSLMTKRTGHRAPAGYRAKDYPPFAVTVDLAIFTIRDGHLQVLLIERADDPYQGCLALPGGFVDIDEDIAVAAARELREETSLDLFHGHLEQLGTYGAPNRDPRMRVVSVAHVAFAPDLPDPVRGSDARAAAWIPVADLLNVGLPETGHPKIRQHLAFDHAEILTDAVRRVQAKLSYTTLATKFVSEPFTLKDLYSVYQIVWGEAGDLMNFRRKVLAVPGFVRPMDETSKGRTGRPAQLFLAGDATEIIPPLTQLYPREVSS
jgi:8-oxo-dGTP diphosphatase